MSFQTKWNDYAVPPIAASAAIVFPFYGFQAKSMEQLGEIVPRFIFKKAVMDGVKTCYSTGFIVGFQVGVQQYLENRFTEKNSLTLLISSFGAAVFSAPLQAGFNAQTLGKSPIEAIKKLTLPKIRAITRRESFFLFSLKINEYMEDRMKKIVGNDPFVSYAMAFTSGSTGAIAGHSADTLLTRLQALEIQLERLHHTTKFTTEVHPFLLKKLVQLDAILLQSLQEICPPKKMVQMAGLLEEIESLSWKKRLQYPLSNEQFSKIWDELECLPLKKSEEFNKAVQLMRALEFPSWKNSMKGWLSRSIAVGVFAMCYKFAKETLTIKQK